MLYSKRANRSVREQHRKEKSAYVDKSWPRRRNHPEIRLARARRIRAEYRQKRDLLEADANDDDGPTSKKRRTARSAATGGDTSMNAKGSKGRGRNDDD
jgi:hypothetical protein